MQTSVSHAGPVTADMKRSSNKRKVCFSYSSVYCSFHRWLCNFRANNICQDHRECRFYRLIMTYAAHLHLILL